MTQYFNNAGFNPAFTVSAAFQLLVVVCINNWPKCTVCTVRYLSHA